MTQTQVGQQSVQQHHEPRHPLASRHFHRVVKRNGYKAQQLGSLHGLTFLLKGRGPLVQLGNVTAMVQTSVSESRVDLLGLTAEFDPATMSVAYTKKRMVHNWLLPFHPGAHGPRLDPRDLNDPTVGPDARPAGEWIRYALWVDECRMRAAGANYVLPTTPQLPAFRAGLATAPALEEMNLDILRQLAAGVLQIPLEGFLARPADEQASALRVVLAGLVTAPSVNKTGLFLVEPCYLKDASRVLRIYEDFTELLGGGASIPNPMWELNGAGRLPINNPSRDIAAKLGIDIAAYNSAAITACQETGAPMPNPEVLDKLIKAVTAALPKGASEDTVVNAINNPDDPVLVPITEATVAALATDLQAIRIMREYLTAHRPHFNSSVTDADILAAVKNHESPMTCSGLCPTQVVYVPWGDDREADLTFSEGRLGRYGASISFFVPEDWRPAPRFPRGKK